MRQCTNCNRGYLASVSRSHSHIKTLRRQKVNLQPRTVDGVRVLLCASCLKATKHKAEMKLKTVAA